MRCGSGAVRKNAARIRILVWRRPASPKRGFLPNSRPGDPASHPHDADGARIRGKQAPSCEKAKLSYYLSYLQGGGVREQVLPRDVVMVVAVAP